MFGKTKCLILIHLLNLAVLKADDQKQTNNFGTDCLIHNNQYKFEYLYSPSEMIPTVQLISLNKVNDFNNFRWSLVETRNQSGLYYLKSSYFGDYLCALFDFGDIFEKRRSVARLKIDKNLYSLNNCQWKIKQHKSIFRTYSIVNLLFDEPLYASRYLFQRKIFLWHSENNIDSKKFKWIIDCQSGHHLWI